VKKLLRCSGSVLLAAALALPAIAQDPTQPKESRRNKKDKAGDEKRYVFKTEVPERTFDLILTRPTDRSVTASLLFAKGGEATLAYGRETNSLTHTSTSRPCPPGEPVAVALTNLLPDTRYFYRVRSRSASGPGPTSPVFSFHTQRKKGQPFTFTVQADSHLDANTDPQVYLRTLSNAVADQPDFHVDLGDTFMSDKHKTREGAFQQYLAQRYYFGQIAPSAPLFLVLGNHDGEAGRWTDGTTNSLAAWSNFQRKRFFPCPVPDSFYTGNDRPFPPSGLLENYYAWEWGDALFIVLDPFWYTNRKKGSDDNWTATLGKEQYDWLAKTLESSRTPYRFVFIHQFAHLYEMGGRNPDSSWGFATNRPGWDKPIHQLMVETGVNVFFHGHDHFFGRQVLDGVVYQEVPQPSARNLNTVTGLAYGYAEGILLPSRGYILATVSPDSVKIDYIRTYLPNEENTSRRNGDIAHTYTIRKSVVTGVASISVKDPVRIYPNPAAGMLHVRFDAMPPRRHDVSILDLQGRLLHRSALRDIPTDTLPEGPCIVQVRTPDFVLNRRILIQH